MSPSANKNPLPLCSGDVSSLEDLWRRGTEFLGSRYGILGGAMTWVSDPALVAAISNAGGFGVLAGGAMNPRELGHAIRLTKERTGATFGVNLIVFHREIEALIECCGENGVTHVFLAGGLISKQQLEKVKSYSMKGIGFAPSLGVAKRLIAMGTDALVLEGNEAGGHVGPVSTYVLAQEILPHVNVPVFIAGGIGEGVGIAGYLLMGAAGCQLGTRFVCAKESCAHPRFKDAFIRANARDATLSVQLSPDFPVIPVRALKNKGKENFLAYQREMIEAYEKNLLTKEETQLKIELFWAGSLRRAVIEGDIEHGSLMAGQSVGMVTGIESCEIIIETLVEQTKKALARITGLSRMDE